jgi:hypothetical protein
MFNAFVKLYNFHYFSTCSIEEREVVVVDENIGHVEREEKL